MHPLNPIHNFNEVESHVKNSSINSSIYTNNLESNLRHIGKLVFRRVSNHAGNFHLFFFLNSFERYCSTVYVG